MDQLALNASLSADQNGRPRFRNGDLEMGAAIDIGAFEHQRPPFIVDTNLDLPIAGSLRTALEDAEDAEGWDHITFDLPTFPLGGIQTMFVLVGQGTLNFNSPLHMDTPENERLLVSSTTSSGVSHVTDQTFVQIDDALIQGGSAADGGGILNDGDLRIRNVTLTGNTATRGGAIFNANTLTVEDSHIGPLGVFSAPNNLSLIHI